MKRISLVLTLLLTIGLVGAFAVEDIEPVVDFSASAETTFGVDLNEDVSTGFDTTAEGDLSIMWVDTTVEKGEGDVYGWIQVEDIELGAEIDEESDDDEVLTGSLGDINARVIFDPAYLQISTKPDMSYENAENLRLLAADDNDPVDSIGTNDLVEPNAGIIIGADNLAGMMDVAFKVGSFDTYEKNAAVTGVDGVALLDDGSINTLSAANASAATIAAWEGADNFVEWLVEPVKPVDAGSGGNTDNDYVFGLDLTARPMEMVSIDASVVFSTDYDNDGIGFTLNPVFTMDGLEAGVPFDGKYGEKVLDAGGYPAEYTIDGNDTLSESSGDATSSDEEFWYEFAPYLTFDLTEDGSHVGLWSYVSGSTLDTDRNMPLDIKLGFAEVEDGFVPGLETSLYGYMFDMLKEKEDTTGEDKMALGVEFHTAYDIDGIKPFMDLYWANKKDTLLDDNLDAAMLVDDDTVFDSDTEVLDLTAGVELALIENTVFTLQYESANLLDDDLVHTSDGSTGIDKGRITFSTEISY